MGKVINLKGCTFGRLTVLERSQNKICANKQSKVMWKCICTCGNIVDVEGSKLKNGHTQSCGCLQKERTSQARQKQNKIENCGDLIKIYDSYGNCCITNKEEKEKLSTYYWSKSKTHGYWIAYGKGKYKGYLRIHDFIMQDKLIEGTIIDHQNNNKDDNRKENLRVVTRQINNLNVGIKATNKSGCTGIWYNVNDGKWESYINYHYKKYHLGRFDDKEEAVLYRKIAQNLLFGEYSYDCSQGTTTKGNIEEYQEIKNKVKSILKGGE